MLPIRSLALLLTLLSLVACEQSTNQAEQPRAEAVKAHTAVTGNVAKAEPAPAVNKSSAADPQSAVQPKPKPPVVVRKHESEPAEAKAPLDLSLHPNVFDPLALLEPLSDLSTPLLPPMFVEKSEPDSPFQLNGKLITNERGDDYWQSVEGAQLQFEFRQ